MEVEMILQKGQTRSKNISKKQKQTTWGKDGEQQMCGKGGQGDK